MKTTRKLTEGAIMIAMAAVLSFIKVPVGAFGGSVTAASMVPIIVFALRHGTGWGMLASLTYAGIQMLIGFYPPPTPDFLSFVLVIALDYVIAFGVLGLAGLIAKPFGEKRIGAGISAAVTVFLRFVCHLFSGILIWKVYAGEMSAFMYSLTYNGSYMIFELIITTAVITVFWKQLNSLGRSL